MYDIADVVVVICIHIESVIQSKHWGEFVWNDFCCQTINLSLSNNFSYWYERKKHKKTIFIKCWILDHFGGCHTQILNTKNVLNNNIVFECTQSQA